MKPLFALFSILLVASTLVAAEPAFVAPYESGTGFVPRGALDECVLAGLRKRGIEPSNPCSDAVFLRRVYLDVTGTLPEPLEAHRFLRECGERKRAALINALLEGEDHVYYQTLKWGDLLRVKAEFPINLWPNAVQAYHRWILEAVRENRPVDRFARELLTASGSNFRQPAVNFYRAVRSRAPEDIAAAVALTFMGTRLERWPASRREAMAKFFSRIVYKPTSEWKEEVVICDPSPSGPLETVFPDGVAVTIPEDRDPREVFADWLLSPGNPWFARSVANRAWSWVMGRGVVEEPDDLRPDNPPANAELLACLERELVAAKFDLKALLRLILSSRTYQSSSIPRAEQPEAAGLFAHYPVRRLDAEVLLDALCRLDGRGESYVSIVPEPFTYLPNLRRSTRLADGTITSSFLEMFGRPARDSGRERERTSEPTDAQRLYLLNSSAIQRRIERSPWLRRLASGRRRGRDRDAPIRQIYLAVLSRDPTFLEQRRAAAYFRGGKKGRRAATVDLVWALINTKEFLYRH